MESSQLVLTREEIEPEGCPPVGEMVDGYEVTGEHMLAQVYNSYVVRAVNTEDSGEVVLKVSRNDEKANIGYEATVHEEISEHPNIVAFVGAGVWKERPYIATEYQKNQSLHRLIANTSTQEHQKTTEPLRSIIEQLDQDLEQANIDDIVLCNDVLSALTDEIKGKLIYVTELDEAIGIVVREANDYGYELDTASATTQLITKHLLERTKDSLPRPVPNAETVERTVRILGDAATALVFMHDYGYVHGDVKLGNVYVGDDHRGMLGDFGTAVPIDKDGIAHRQGIIGTRGNMAPENYQNKACIESDVFGLATTAYEALTDRKPFIIDESTQLQEDLLALNIAPTSPELINKNIPQAVGRAIMRGLSFDKEDRPSMEEMRQVFTGTSAVTYA